MGRGRFAADIIGQTFGQLTVISRSGSCRRGHSVEATWLCRCACSTEVIVSGVKLRSGNTTSCGCWQRRQARDANRKPLKDIFLRSIIGIYRRNAKARNLCWQLTDDECYHLITQSCAYCGITPLTWWEPRYNKERGGFMWNGIDRKDPGKGYVSDNVTTACWTCNHAKSDLTPAQWSAWIQSLVNFNTQSRVA